MYAALWRVLPGPAWLKVIILVIAVAAILYGLMYYVFPWASVFISPAPDSTIE